MSFKAPPDTDLGIPLSSMDAVAIDSETTGLNTNSDRVIELAGVQVSGGRINLEKTKSVLINPGIHIPENSTKIHGISDSTVANATRFEAGIKEFVGWIGPRFILGYSLGFDLSILEAEHKRHGTVWSEPRVLDVEELVQVLAPDLPNLALETVQSWLDIPAQKERHRALPDAIATAEIFIKLIPMLKTHGVATYAEADRMCKNVRRRKGGIDRPEGIISSEISNVDTYPYKVKVSDIMTHPVIVDSHITIQTALDTLVRDKIGSVIVRLKGEKQYGILTESDILRAIHAHGSGVLSAPVANYSKKLQSIIHPKEYLYRAMVSMGTTHFRRLAVANDEGEIVGIVSSRDIYGNYSADAIGLGKDILEAQSTNDLGKIWSGLTSVSRSLINSGINARTITAIISRELRGLTQKACQMAEQKVLAGNEFDDLPDYVMVVLGSGGRGESMLAMDQDNAIIYDETDPEGKKDRLLKSIGIHTSEILNEVGVRFCDGGVMASNSKWRKDFSSWEKEISRWMSETQPDDLLNSDIFFDGFPVHGDFQLAYELRGKAMASARNNRPYLSLLKKRATDYKIPMGFFGKWKLENGRIDLKKGGIMPIFSTARVLSLQHGIFARSTADRLLKFRALNLVPDKLIDDLLEAHGLLLALILQQQLDDLEMGISPTNNVAVTRLDGLDQHKLRWALDKLDTLPNLLGVPVL
ncbi:MAG: DUF294 nucleotidyltransferase-like domain-containing protein [Paracoccaceae bacterium]|nr:DUF294 nucleotidyltransferase-like domain-containing protein [Paracoccaceae bacterium]MDE2916202.1 DUF294 nucleotidyltransferase-like domain-containing protein [Paracoccaceae bacterium]